MSTPILPFAVWQSGTNENSLPANDNSLRHEILNGLVIADDVTSQPVSPERGDIYIIPAGATGAQWSLFDAEDITIYDGGTWHAYAPVNGIVLNLGGSLIAFDGSSGYITVGGGGGGSPGGPTNSVQYNTGSAFGGEAAFSYDASTNTVTVDNATLAGLLLTAPTATGGAGIRMPHGTAPTSPVNGDMWTTTAGLYVRINGATVGPLSAGGGSLTNWTEAVNTSTPNATVPVVSFVPNNAATNVDVAINPKGTGAFTLDVADNATTGGNKRGTNAIDLQTTRSAAAQVASGAASVVIGSNNTANATNAVAIGSSCSATGSNSLAVGSTSSATGNGAVAVGSSATAGGMNSLATSGGTASADYALCHGANCTADGQYGLVTGRYAQARAVYGATARTAFLLAVAGDAQSQEYVLMSDTTDATPEAMTTNNAAAAASNQVVLPNTSAYMVTGEVVARQNSTGDCKSWTFSALIKRGANAASTALVGTPTVTSPYADAGASAWALAITANTTTGSLAVGITGEASKSIKWAAQVRSIEVVG